MLGIPAFTAGRRSGTTALGHDTTVLIAGGAGSVTHYTIQLAKLRGARVLTTVSNPEKAAHAGAAGADAIINYRGEDVGERVKAVTDGRGLPIHLPSRWHSMNFLHRAIEHTGRRESSDCPYDFLKDRLAVRRMCPEGRSAHHVSNSRKPLPFEGV